MVLAQVVITGCAGVGDFCLDSRGIHSSATDGDALFSYDIFEFLAEPTEEIKVGRRGADGFSRLRSRFCGSDDHTREAVPAALFAVMPGPRAMPSGMTLASRGGRKEGRTKIQFLRETPRHLRRQRWLAGRTTAINKVRELLNEAVVSGAAAPPVLRRAESPRCGGPCRRAQPIVTVFSGEGIWM